MKVQTPILTRYDWKTRVRHNLFFNQIHPAHMFCSISMFISATPTQKKTKNQKCHSFNKHLCQSKRLYTQNPFKVHFSKNSPNKKHPSKFPLFPPSFL